MKAALLSIIGLTCFLLWRAEADQVAHIQVVDNSFEGGDGFFPDNVVKLRISNAPYFDICSKTELLLSNTAKTDVAKPLIFQNSDRTITGFGASVARASYKIILVYLSSSGEVVINQNFNLKAAQVLKKSLPNIGFDADGLYLDHITGRNLYIGFQSDSGKGSFKFQIKLGPDGQLQMVPHSLKFDN